MSSAHSSSTSLGFVALDDLLKKHGRLTLSATLYVILKIAEEVQTMSAHGRHAGSIPASRVRLHGTKLSLAHGRYPSNAPELRQGEAGDALSDVYEIGSLLYRLLTGARPKGDFEAPSAINPAVDTSLDELVMNALAADPGLRPYSMGALIKDLHGIFKELDLEPSPIELRAFVSDSTMIAVKPPPAPRTEVQRPPQPKRTPPRAVASAWQGVEEDDDDFEPSVVRQVHRGGNGDKIWAAGVAAFAVAMLVMVVS